MVPDGTDATYYVAVFESLTSVTGPVTEEIVVGFGRVQITRVGSTFTVQRLAQAVAAENASSMPAASWQSDLRDDFEANPEYNSLSAADQAAVIGEFIAEAFQQSTSLATDDDALLSPGLVRAIR